MAGQPDPGASRICASIRGPVRGLNHACDLTDKRLLPAYRNISLFLERLRPRYRDPGVYLLVPDSHRLGAQGRRVHAAVRAAIGGLFSTHTDFNVINEFDLDRLPAECRTIVWHRSMAG